MKDRILFHALNLLFQDWATGAAPPPVKENEVYYKSLDTCLVMFKEYQRLSKQPIDDLGRQCFWYDRID